MKTVLVVEDDNLTRKSITSAFKDLGLEVNSASDGKEGLELALTVHPDVIVTDVRMPEMDGLQMIDNLRKDEWGKNVPVVILTSDSSTTTLNQALLSGVTVYLSKNELDPTNIANQILQALGQ